MPLFRPAFAQHPLSFGRGPVRALGRTEAKSVGLAADLRLFAVTFAAGFLFVSILIG